MTELATIAWTAPLVIVYLIFSMPVWLFLLLVFFAVISVGSGK
jgi:hypothetical protein